MMKIVFPEINNPIIRSALKAFPDIEAVPAENLDVAAQMLGTKKVDSMIAGIDAPSRDVILACKKHLNLTAENITSSFLGKRRARYIMIADGAVCKKPTKEQLFEIALYSMLTMTVYTGEPAHVAMLSYSTNGSGGKKNPDLEKIAYVLERMHDEWPDVIIDGEMQLDAAVDPEVCRKKFISSEIEGDANVLVCPDLNSANILYKGLEHLGGWTMAGPILQGFDVPVSDLSRGSTVEDVKLTIDVMRKMYAWQHNPHGIMRGF